VTTVAPLWRPYSETVLLTADMATGPAHVSAADMLALSQYLDALVAARGIPVHVNIAFNAVYFGYDLDQRGYVGGPLDLDAFPSLTHHGSQPGLPVGSMVRLTAAKSALYGEMVYREGAHSSVDEHGHTPAWLSGAPSAATGPPGGSEPPLGDGLVSRVELSVVDFTAFTPGVAPKPEQLQRLRQRGRFLDELGHVRYEATYPSASLADSSDTFQYQRNLLTSGRDQLLSAVAPVPLPTLLADGAGEAELEAALAGVFATVAAALAGLDSVRLWGAYAFSRAALGARLSDEGALGREDLGAIAGQLANAAVPSRAGRWAVARTVEYTAIGPLVRGMSGAQRQLLGTGYANAVVHANTVVGDWARREADPDNGLLPDGVHLRVDDTWQGGGIWRAERPGSAPGDVDVTDPLRLGWAEAAGLLPPATEPEPEPEAEPEPEPETEPTPEPEPEPEPEVELEEEPEDEGRVLSVTDSQVMWVQTLRLAHQVGSYLPTPRKLADLWEDTMSPGPVKLLVNHDGYTLEPDEASQDVTLSRDGAVWSLTEVAWPLEFFPGIVLRGTWQRGGRLLRVTSTLLDAPVTVDGMPIEHVYDPAVLTREGAPKLEANPTWAARLLAVIRRAGQLDVQGCAVIEEAHLVRLACDDTHATDDAPARAALADLIRIGKVRSDVAGRDHRGDLVTPCPPGAAGVSVMRYTPVVVVGPRRAPVPAVLRGLISTSGLDARLLREIDVAGHLRHLPQGWQASSEKKAEYREFRARFHLAGPSELPSGYTFVSPFQRGV